jgi:hypothetical protein
MMVLTFDRTQFIPITAICFHLIILRTENAHEGGSNISGEHAPSLPLRFMHRNGTDTDNISPGGPMVTITRHVDDGSMHTGALDRSQDSLWTDAKAELA